ncbi:hypothetical protein WCD74_01570 [Actinomycetospora sp. OC33-EN08]|uniref:Uncharacterized protein n=1 Tax=Actinomycetospora aurantiaca TaxID=3129233 RepID=A0ABU8MGK9_9PSEU
MTDVAPLHADPERRLAAAHAIAVDVPDVDVDALAAEISASFDLLRNEGVRLCGRLPVEDPGASATVTVAVRALAPTDDRSGSFSERAIAALRDDTAVRRPLADTRAIDLPCGPAVASLVFGEFELLPGTVPSFRAEFLVPTPEWDGVVVVDVQTTDEAAWPEASQEAVRIARSLRFLDDGETAREGEHLLRL